jgi:hypothetical protein
MFDTKPASTGSEAVCNRAYEAREIARLMDWDETKQRLNQMAEKYEQLADQAETAPAEAAEAAAGNRAKAARDR